MAEHHFVVIGNGPAGNQAALTLREKARDARITLISRHRGGCYRPHLLPHFIAGKMMEETLYVFSPSSYKEREIKFRKGQEVVDIDLERREILLDHREIIPFDGLIIAVGGKPRIPEYLAVFEDLMLTLKTLEDGRIWRQKLGGEESILMIGGDLTSISLTRELVDMGKKVYFAVNEEAFWPLRFNDSLFEEVSLRLSRKSIEVLKYSRIKGMKRLEDGTIEVGAAEETFRVGLIGAFFGLVPDIRFLARSGLRIDRGILVDEYLHTGFEGIYATGDCAQIYHPEIRDYWVSIGHDNAVALGRTAALNLVGEKVIAEPGVENICDVRGINVNTSWWMEF